MNPLHGMTPEQRRTFVLDANTKGFEGDTYLADKVKSLCEKHKVNAVIETGTYQGYTTEKFAQLADKVITIEANENYYKANKTRLKQDNIFQVLGDSEAWLKGNLSNVSGNVLFYLDAHWHKVCPLFGELEAIAKHGLKPVIAIHDFKVPNKDFGFDKFPDGKEYTFEVIQSHIEAIYGKNGYTVSYNEEATGCYRGVIFIEPKELAPDGTEFTPFEGSEAEAKVKAYKERFPADDEQSIPTIEEFVEKVDNNTSVKTVSNDPAMDNWIEPTKPTPKKRGRPSKKK